MGGWPRRWSGMAGTRSLPPVRAAISRARPRTLRQSPRLGVTLTSNHPVVQAQVLVQRCARGRVPGQFHDAPVIVGKPQLLLGAEHALRGDSPDGAAFDGLSGRAARSLPVETRSSCPAGRWARRTRCATARRRSGLRTRTAGRHRDEGRTSATSTMTAPASSGNGRTASTSRPAWVSRSASSAGPKDPPPAVSGASTNSISQL